MRKRPPGLRMASVGRSGTSVIGGAALAGFCRFRSRVGADVKTRERQREGDTLEML